MKAPGEGDDVETKQTNASPFESSHDMWSIARAPTVHTNRPATQPLRPDGWPLFHQNWSRLLFLHWPVEFEPLRALLPARLQLQRFDGTAWIGLTPFAISGMRPSFVPPLPLIGRSLELNVRTYVVADDVPGVWFLSLDASNPLAVWAARLGFHLPYYQAQMSLDERAGRMRFRSWRTHPDAPAAEFEADWETGELLPAAVAGTLEHFLIERYWLYCEDNRRLYRARIHHDRWPLRHARVTHLSSSMLASHGLPPPAQPPLAHALARPLHVGIWPLQRVR